jgi:hypothetical protein
MDGFRGDAVHKKVGDIEQLIFNGSLTLGDVQTSIGLAGAHREALFLGVCDDKITISLNKATGTVVIDDHDVRQTKKRRRVEDPFDDKIDKSMAALKEKISDAARVAKTRELLKALCALKDVSSGAPAVDTFSVFLKAEALVLLKVSFKTGARVSLSAMARALNDCSDGALSKIEASDGDRDAAVLLLVNVSAATEAAPASAPAPAPPASPAP